MDPQRLKVDRGLLHHAVTPLWDDKSKKWIAQWFSDNGFERGYGGNPANWNGNYNAFTGERSYSQTHAVGQRVTSKTPDATAAEKAMGYRVFYIIKNPEKRITYHAGNWNINQRSIAIENLGDYRNYPLRDKDMQVIADFFRPLDKKVNGAMHILLHNEVTGTICPARIAEGRNKIVAYINNPPKKPAPKPEPKPTPPKSAKASLTWTKLPKVVSYRLNKDTSLWSFDSTTWDGIKSVAKYKKGHQVNAYGKVVNKTLNATYLLTEYSYTSNTANGFNVADLDEIKPATPKPKPVEPETPPSSSTNQLNSDEKTLEEEKMDSYPSDDTKSILAEVVRGLKKLWSVLVDLWNVKY